MVFGMILGAAFLSKPRASAMALTHHLGTFTKNLKSGHSHLFLKVRMAPLFVTCFLV